MIVHTILYVADQNKRELDPIRPRDWGDRAGYVMDHDGHVLAFASKQVEQ